jgi:hypothetical protein
VILKVGQSLSSTVDSTTVVVVRAPKSEITPACGGAEMIAGKHATEPSVTLDPDHVDATQLGKRYVDEAGSIELLCTKPGQGRLTVDGAPLVLKAAKPLPSSD